MAAASASTAWFSFDQLVCNFGQAYDNPTNDKPMKSATSETSNFDMSAGTLVIRLEQSAVVARPLISLDQLAIVDRHQISHGMIVDAIDDKVYVAVEEDDVDPAGVATAGSGRIPIRG